VNGLLSELGGRAHEQLQNAVEVKDQERFPSKDEIYSQRRTWKRIRDVVAVVVDLKDSTRMSFRNHPQTSARVYEAATGNCARIVETFSPEFVDIQGDGLFALYHGEKAYERALCAGITLKTFSERHLVPEIGRMPGSMSENVPDTGLKVGMASGVLAVKKVGVRGEAEPVWAGRPVNWASKCAGRANAHELIATDTVFRHFEGNDYVTHSCGCPNGSLSELWSEAVVEKLPEEAARCRVLRTSWCTHHGDEFCKAILHGRRDRPELSGDPGTRGT
jgi:class 3 adenylate cyclase